LITDDITFILKKMVRMFLWEWVSICCHIIKFMVIE